MKARLWIILLLTLCLSAWGCGIIHDHDDAKSSETVGTGRGGGGAPCIYLYPEEAGEVSVTLLPAEDAWLTSTDPEYVDGWTVWAEPDGLIDGAYDYLYYSCEVAMDFQMDEGWAIEAEEIFPWFKETLPKFGLSQAETADFVDYWSEHLPYSPWYLVYPQYNDLVAGQMDIAIDPEPDNMLRLWFVIDKAEKPEPLTAPEFRPFERSGFTVVEWGVVLRIETEEEEAGSVTT
ncbi:MAG TPA: hypothetical protein VMW42_10930 [Desulfatiglandales bacterium]|nr:hypothetical protein [Desulfatiglandales bacterium]